jgi:hypothetical protein
VKTHGRFIKQGRARPRIAVFFFSAGADRTPGDLDKLAPRAGSTSAFMGFVSKDPSDGAMNFGSTAS